MIQHDEGDDGGGGGDDVVPAETDEEWGDDTSDDDEFPCTASTDGEDSTVKSELEGQSSHWYPN